MYNVFSVSLSHHMSKFNPSPSLPSLLYLHCFWHHCSSSHRSKTYYPRPECVSLQHLFCHSLCGSGIRVWLNHVFLAQAPPKSQLGSLLGLQSSPGSPGGRPPPHSFCGYWQDTGPSWLLAKVPSQNGGLLSTFEVKRDGDRDRLRLMEARVFFYNLVLKVTFHHHNLLFVAPNAKRKCEVVQKAGEKFYWRLFSFC